MTSKKTARLKRARKSRSKIARLEALRLCVHRTPRHFYAQVLESTGARVLVSACTLDSEVKKSLKYSGNCAAATAVGQLLAERAKAAAIETVAFDRAGFRYHGRVKAFADSARAHGLKF